MKSAAVVGVGTIGAGWAPLFLAAGYEVRLFDERPESVDMARCHIETALEFMFAHGLASGDLETSLERLRVCKTIDEALEAVDLVQESIVEDYEKKSDLYEAVEAVLPAHVPIASSSSGLLISKLQAGRHNPERFVIGHPWNPPYLIPLVEIVPGPATAPSVVEGVRTVYQSLGMDPVLVRREVPGHIGNRLAAALWREAVDLVISGVATVEDVDRVIRSGPGLRWALMGVHLTYHLGGGAAGIEYFIDHLRPAFESWWEDGARWTKLPEPAKSALSRGVAEEVGDHTYESMVKSRDELLAALLKLNAHRTARNPLVD